MIAVVIPSKNLNNLIPCVEAVRRHEPDAEITVVDDGLPRVLTHQVLRPVRFVAGVKPFIYSRNINVGIVEALQDKPEGVVLLNDDALLESPGGFSLMAQACRENPAYGLVGAVTKVVGNRNQFPKGTGALRDEPRMVCFFCVYLPASTIGTVGLLDEQYTGYGMDDDDYSFEVRKAGLRIGVHDGCYVDHGSLVSSYRGDPRTPADFQPNLKKFIAKWGHDNWGRRP